MSALEELRDGTPGQAFAAALYRCTAAVGRARGFPPPEGHNRWSAEATVEVAHDWLASDRARAQLSEVALLAADEQALLRLLQTCVLNFLRDRGRATAKGALIRRLRDVLDRDERFATVPTGRAGAGNIALTAVADLDDPPVFGGRETDLVSAAWSTPDVRIVRWRPDARREGPLADAPSLAAVCERVLSVAGGSMRMADLAAVVAQRFGLRTTPAMVAIEDVDRWQETLAPQTDTSEQALEQSARAVLAQFSPLEQLVLAHLGAPVRALADITGLSKSTAAVHAQRVTALLRSLLLDDPDAERIAAIAQQLARRQEP